MAGPGTAPALCSTGGCSGRRVAAASRPGGGCEGPPGRLHSCAGPHSPTPPLHPLPGAHPSRRVGKRRFSRSPRATLAAGRNPSSARRPAGPLRPLASCGTGWVGELGVGGAAPSRGQRHPRPGAPVTSWGPGCFLTFRTVRSRAVPRRGWVQGAFKELRPRSCPLRTRLLCSPIHPRIQSFLFPAGVI